jgi:hypothetical protein
MWFSILPSSIIYLGLCIIVAGYVAIIIGFFRGMYGLREGVFRLIGWTIRWIIFSLILTLIYKHFWGENL